MSKIPTGTSTPSILRDLASEAEREVVAAIGDPHEHEPVGPFALDDLVGDPRERPADVVRSEDPAHTGTPPRPGEEARKLDCISWSPFPASRDRT